MKALYLQSGKLTLRDDLPLPQPSHGEVLLKIRLAGICGTDLALLKGYADFNGVPGHEFVAEVAATGEGVAAGWCGKRVVAEINQWCGNCEQCRRRQFSHCLKRRVVGIRNHQGAFAEYLVVNANTLHVVPSNIDDRQAVFIEPLAAAFRIVEQLQPHSYQELILVGAGRLGQLIARVMVLQGKRIKVVVRHKRQCDLLRKLPLECITESEVAPHSSDVVIDASGHASGLALALKAVRPQGVCVIKSSYPEPLPIDLTQWVINEIKLLGSRCGPFTMALDALARGQIETTSLIDGCYPFDEYQVAFAAASQAGSMKLLLRAH